MRHLTDTFKLSNGVGIPCVGFGTWQTPSGEVAVDSVKTAIEAGYRHIDTAAAYQNEKDVGIGVKQSGVERSELFITSKLWNSERGYDKTMKAFERTVKALQLDYLDLYLIHWPAAPQHGPEWQKTNRSTWKAFEQLYAEKRIRAIGVSNFLPHHLEPLVADAEVKPMVNQIELHVGYTQPEAVEYCKNNGILLEAWSPLGTGRVLEHPLLIGIAKKHNVTVAQLCIRWCLQNDFLPLPKSVTPSRIRENTNVFSFEISAEDKAAMNGLSGFGFSGNHPDKVRF
jgi:diketogulonate reductase-like aldo/keto reductase